MTEESYEYVYTPKTAGHCGREYCIIHCCSMTIFQGRKDAKLTQWHLTIYLSLGSIRDAFYDFFHSSSFYRFFFSFGLHWEFSTSRHIQRRTGGYCPFFFPLLFFSSLLFFPFLHFHINLALLLLFFNLLKRMVWESRYNSLGGGLEVMVTKISLGKPSWGQDASASRRAGLGGYSLN